MLRKNQDLKAWLMTSTLSFKNHPVRIEMQHVSLWNTKIFYSINSHSNFHSWLNPYLIIQCEIFSIPRYKARTVLQSVILVLLSFSSFRVYFNHQIYQNVSSKSEQKKKKIMWSLKIEIENRRSVTIGPHQTQRLHSTRS